MHRKSFIPAFKKSTFSILVIALVASGISAQAAGVLNSPSGGYLLCVAPVSREVSNPSTKVCPKGYKRIVLGVKGKTGAQGIAGIQGVSGASGPAGVNGSTILQGSGTLTNEMGVDGDYFFNSALKMIYGPKSNGTWPQGVSLVGTTGASGSNGANGASGTKIAELSICGSGGTSLCKVGLQGPGGGTIFFVDYNDQYNGFNYLEVAPIKDETLTAWSSDWEDSLTAVAEWKAGAVGNGQANTAAMLTDSGDYRADTSGAAFYADSLISGGKSDWFLGSRGEMKLMSNNLWGLGLFPSEFDPLYWCSNEGNLGSIWVNVWSVLNDATSPMLIEKSASGVYVRPIRAF